MPDTLGQDGGADRGDCGTCPAHEQEGRAACPLSFRWFRGDRRLMRAAFALGADPEDPQRRILASIKCNLGPMPKALQFEVVPAGKVSRIAWTGTSEATAGDIVCAPKSTGGKLARPKNSFRTFSLQAQWTCRRSRTHAKAEGISLATYKRARKELQEECVVVAAASLVSLVGGSCHSRT